jgi:hypothetical protein
MVSYLKINQGGIMSERKELDFKTMASYLMFNPPSFITYVKGNGAKFRKGKTSKDINNAIIKAKRNGMQKVEYEADMLELYLKDVFKKFGTPRNK